MDYNNPPELLLGGNIMISREAESDRLFLKPLSFDELLYINKNEFTKIQTSIEKEALLDEVKIAIDKKIDKMKNINTNVHEWFTYWLIISKSSHKGIGFIGFKGIPNENGYTEVGYSISSNYREKGFMTEALYLLINWASKYPECKGITAAKVLKTNIGSNKVLNNCKFTLENSSDEYNNYILKGL